MKTTYAQCPKCGATLEINEVANNSHACKSKSVAKSADARIAAMKKAGIDTSKYFSVLNGNGEGVLMRWENGIPTAVSEDDPVLVSIIEKGSVPNRDLFRRWVMSQMFHMLNYKSYYRNGNGFTAALHAKGYEYQWKMLEDEFKAQARMERNGDKENLAERQMFFNKKLAEQMAEEYHGKLGRYLEKLSTHKCKGVPYKRVKGLGDVFVSDFWKKMHAPIFNATDLIKGARSTESLYLAVREFNKVRVCLSAEQHRCWIDAFKGAGAFYTMKNLIMFHGCKVRYCGSTLSREESLRHITCYAKDNAGYELLGLMKDFLEYNCIDPAQKLKEWRNRK